MNKPVGQFISIEYEWCQYSSDVEHGLYTVREIRTKDIAKVYSQAEALFLIEKLKASNAK